MDAVDTTISSTHGLNLLALNKLRKTFAEGNLPIRTIAFFFVSVQYNCEVMHVTFYISDFGTMNKKLGEVWWSIPLKEKNVSTTL